VYDWLTADVVIIVGVLVVSVLWFGGAFGL
jgi:hypothetical protein